MRVRRLVLPWLGDLLLVSLFVLIGRGSHGEDAAGFAGTLLPFLAGLQTGWLLVDRSRPLAPLRSGATVWLSTVVVGLVLRLLSGDGAAPAFVIVTALVLGVLLVGWRLVVTGIRALVSRRALEKPVNKRP